MKIFRSIRTKIILSIVFMALVISTVLVCISYFTYKNTMDKEYETRANQIVDTAMQMLDSDAIAKYVEDAYEFAGDEKTCLERLESEEDLLAYVEEGFARMQTEEYQEMLSTLRKIRSSNDVRYIYIFCPQEQGAYYIFDTDESEEQYPYAFYEPYAEGFDPEAIQMALEGKEIPAVISDSEFGWLITVQHPYKHNGETIAYVSLDISMDKIVKERYDYLFTSMIILLVVTVLFSVGYFILFNRIFVRPIKQMTAATADFAGDSSNEEKQSAISSLSIKTGDEIQTLCDSLKKMECDLIDHIENLKTVTAEKERIGAELDVATKIQASMLPCIFPAFPERKEFEVFASMNPAKEVGGDFYDFFMVDDDNLAIVVADVSGKGVPAALFMVIGKTLIKDHTTSGKDLGEVFTEVNQLLCESNSEELFITAFVGVLNLKTGEFRYVNAGHEMPFISKNNAPFEPYKIRAAFVLAGMEGMKYKSGSIQLEPGDKIFQYTDGVTEATDKDNQLFGMDRLEKTLSKLSDKQPSEILSGVKADIDEFVGEAPQFDDITMLCLEYRGDGEEK